jgi:GTPase SAR1 family protein
MELFNNTIPNISLIIAPPNCGKTYLVKYLLTDLYINKKIKYGVVFCSTNFNTNNFDYIPEKYIYSSYQDDIITNLIDIQINQIKENKKAEPCFIVFDDMIGMINFQSKTLTELFTKYRHYNITVLLTTQYIYKIPPLIRECSTFIFLFFVTSRRSLKAAFECFFCHFDNIEQCKKFIINNTGDNKFIFIKSQEYDQKKRYFVSKAPSKIKKITFNY